MATTQHLLKPRDLKADPPTIKIHVQEGTIYCTPNGGALRAGANTKLSWECDDHAFTLTFDQLGGAEAKWGPLHSALVGKKQVINTVSPRVTAGEEPPFYEYTVRVGNLVLDPIIIVDK
jgi:hypothetical protein